MFSIIAAFSFSAFFASIYAFEVLHWQGQLALILSQTPSIITALTPYPKAAGAWKTISQILNVFSLLSHRDSPNTLKAPLTQSQPPLVVGSAVSPAKLPGALALIFLLPLLLHLSACATVPVTFYTGPAIAPIEEISAKNPVPALAAGYQASLGIGSYTMMSHVWDVVEVGALVLGGVVLPGSSPVGALQVGGEVSTLNGLIGIGCLATPYTESGAGFLQGGAPGTTWAALLNIQGLVAAFGGASVGGDGKDKVLAPKLPRGGL